jgi:GNAT superfamily N-acetyltransferase
VEITRVDPDDNAAVEALNRIDIAADSYDNPYPTPSTVDEVREQLRNTDSNFHVESYLGLEEGRPAAAGGFFLPITDNVDKAWLDASVEPALRNRGFGSAMLDFLIEAVNKQGRTTVTTGVTYPFDADESHPYRRFATKHGFLFSQSDVHRVLALPANFALLRRLATEAAPHHRDYSFAEYAGMPPAEILEDYCVLLNQILTDAPTGELPLEEGRIGPAGLADRFTSLRDQGRTVYTTVAFDGAGVPVAHNQLIVPEHDPAKIFNWDTMVLRDHRGHRLGMATKARNLLTVAQLYPDRTSVHTWNAESNTHMIAVNDAMGFVPVSYLGEYYRRL